MAMKSPEYITAPAARREILGISEMTEWRWRHDPDLEMPKSVKIRGRRYYRAAELREWMASRAQAA